MEPYYNEDKTKIAVLVSGGFGAGWSTWGAESLAWDSRVVEWWLNHHSQEYGRALEHSGLFRTPPSREYTEFAEKLKEWGYEHVYMGGYIDISLHWVDRYRKWRIEEYDGSEYLVYADEERWNEF